MPTHKDDKEPKIRLWEEPESHGPEEIDVEAGYEKTDVRVTGIVVFLTALAVFVAVTGVLCYGIGMVLNAELNKEDGPNSKWTKTVEIRQLGNLPANPEMQRKVAELAQSFPTPRVQLDDGLRVGRRIGMQSAQPAKLIRMGGDVGKQFGEPRTRLSVLFEAKPRGGQGAAPGSGFAAIILEFRLVVESIHTGHCAFHKDEDDPFCLCGEVGRLGPQRIRSRGFGRHGPGILLAEQTGERKVTKSGAGRPQEGSPRYEWWVVIRHKGISGKEE